jgi:hypothetical protein
MYCIALYKHFGMENINFRRTLAYDHENVIQNEKLTLYLDYCVQQWCRTRMFSLIRGVSISIHQYPSVYSSIHQYTAVSISIHQYPSLYSSIGTWPTVLSRVGIANWTALYEGNSLKFYCRYRNWKKKQSWYLGNWSQRNPASLVKTETKLF